MRRSSLVLLNDLVRSPLRLLREMDERLRQLERQAVQGDRQAVKRLAWARQKATPKPDDKYHWRWNGKGWYTRPGWNGGQCPPGTSPTHHNTCLPDNAHQDDRAQYRTSTSVEPVEGGPAKFLHRETDPITGRESEFYSNSDIRHSPRSAHHLNVDTDHPDGPVFRRKIPSWDAAARELQGRRGRARLGGSPDPGLPPNMRELPREPGQQYPDIEVAQPFPQDPEHIPPIDVGAASIRKMEPHKEKIKQHYVDQGYDPDYVDDLVNDREMIGIDHQGHRRREYRMTNPPPDGETGYPKGSWRGSYRRSIRRRRQKG